MGRSKVKLIIKDVETGKVEFCGYVTRESVLRDVEEMFMYDTYKRYTLTFQRE